MTTSEPTRVVTLITVLRQTAKLMVDELIERLHAAGYGDVTTAHHPVFENIDAEGTRLTLLAARIGMTHQSMGELVEALERRGYVERRPDPSDRRARLVLLTAKGRRLARRAVREIEAIEAAWLTRYATSGSAEDVRATLEAGLRQAAGATATTAGPA
jgi:DNA-binding MarR family transcriptional regulator